MATGTTLRIVKYLSNTPRSTACSGQKNKINPAPASKQSVVSPLSFEAASGNPTSWSVMILFLTKIRRKLPKNLKIESAKADPEDVENTYGIGHIKIGEDKHD